MKIDVTMEITPQMFTDSTKPEYSHLLGHLGTHFDVMDKQFPLEYTERRGIVFDVSYVSDRDIDSDDIDIKKVQPGTFVAFYTGFSDTEPYGTKRYFKEHPQLSANLIDALLEIGVSVIGLDFAGIRRGAEHIPTDKRAADKNVFIIENLCGLKSVVETGSGFTAHTYPMNCTGMTGLPCRVIFEI